MGPTALVGASVAGLIGAQPADAADGIRLDVGGYFRAAYMAVIHDGEAGEPGNETNTGGFFSDAEIQFTASTTLDNGVEVGARIELEGETEEDQIDEAWVYFSSGFGEFRIGSLDDALGNLCVLRSGPASISTPRSATRGRMPAVLTLIPRPTTTTRSRSEWARRSISSQG